MKSQNIALRLVLAVTFAGATLLSFYTPMVLDDWAFRCHYLEYNHGEDSLSFGALWDVLCFSRSCDNSRLSNVVASAFAAVPFLHFLFPLLTGVVVTLLSYGLCRIGLGRRPGWKAAAVSSGLCLLILPWRDALFAADYSLNYPYAAVLTLSLIAVLLRSLRCGFNGGRLAAALVLAVFAGWWHEGFAYTTICGGGILTIVRRFRMPWQWYAVGLVYFAVTTLAFVCPGMIERMGRSIGEAGALSPAHVLFNTLPVLAVAFVVSLGLITGRYRKLTLKITDSNVFIMFASIAVSGTIMSLSVEHSVRTSFWPACAALVLMWRIYACMPEMPRWLTRSTVAVTSCVALFVLFSAIKWQRMYWKEASEIEKLARNSPTGVVYYDIIGREACPVTTMYIPVRHAWQNKFNMYWISQFMNSDIGIVPTGLRSFDINEAETLPGDAGYKRYRNYLLYIPENKDDVPCDNLLYTFDDGTSSHQPDRFTYRFVNDDGRTLYYHKANKIIPDRIVRIDVIK